MGENIFHDKKKYFIEEAITQLYCNLNAMFKIERNSLRLHYKILKVLEFIPLNLRVSRY